jgi:hypothetical protein
LTLDDGRLGNQPAPSRLGLLTQQESELAREKPESTAGCQDPRVIVDLHRWQASSYSGSGTPANDWVEFNILEVLRTSTGSKKTWLDILRFRHGWHCCYFA